MLGYQKMAVDSEVVTEWVSHLGLQEGFGFSGFVVLEVVLNQIFWWKMYSPSLCFLYLMKSFFFGLCLNSLCLGKGRGVRQAGKERTHTNKRQPETKESRSLQSSRKLIVNVSIYTVYFFVIIALHFNIIALCIGY